MIFPKPFAEGAILGLIAPASPISRAECIQCKKCLEELGYRVILGESLKRGANRSGYLAGGSKERAEDVNRMFQDSQIEAIFCVRGGYGSAQILEYLDYEVIRKNPKVFVGYSDITSLHSVFQRYGGFVTFHGPMVKTDLLQRRKHMDLSYMLESLGAACNMQDVISFVNPPGEKMDVIREGEAVGRLAGGNLSVLAKSLGTPYSPVLEGAILFLEEVGESIPRIDMYLTQLRYAGVFQQIHGILLGDFTDCTNERYDHNLKIEVFLREWFWDLKIPVMGNLWSDHRVPMGTLPMGAKCRMGDGKLRFYKE
ncbi:MAG: LD-carboxypeptidase [Lachnospiraceae bacterium]|nr:LD-carboxypeptidase [Lachnospiraceae bacterium]